LISDPNASVAVSIFAGMQLRSYRQAVAHSQWPVSRYGAFMTLHDVVCPLFSVMIVPHDVVAMQTFFIEAAE
jgi:hypothetical protein